MKKNWIHRLLRVVFATALLSFVSCDTKIGGEVNVYSHRHYETDRILFARFSELTGIKVNVVEASADQLIERLKAEGDASPADILITVDAGRLERARLLDLLQPVRSTILETKIPAHLRNPEGYWFALTKRARVIVYNPDKLQPSQVATYSALTQLNLKGRVVVRSSSNVYNQSLVASWLASRGESETLTWMKGLVANFARAPEGGDRDQIKAVALGEADAALVNTYYLGQMLNSTNAEEVKLAERVRVSFPDQEGLGTHINVSGAGVTKSSKNKANAIRFIEFLADSEAQGLFASANYEYPVLAGVSWSPSVMAWASAFKEDSTALGKLGELNASAVRLMEEAGWK